MIGSPSPRAVGASNGGMPLLAGLARIDAGFHQVGATVECQGGHVWLLATR
jgi:hypothetical protein